MRDIRVCVITDNEFLFHGFKKIIQKYSGIYEFEFYYSYFNTGIMPECFAKEEYRPICLKNENEQFFSKFDLFLSIHCKQLFPKELVVKHRCINIHPGFNPYNRGWFPQVFSIIDKQPVGVTIHEMDAELDHGPIIIQQEIPIYEYETSFDVYQKIQELELKLLADNLEVLILGDYKTWLPDFEGNINNEADFRSLCELDMDRVGTFREFLDILRATTFAPYDNAYFLDKDNNKIFVSVNLKKS